LINKSPEDQLTRLLADSGLSNPGGYAVLAEDGLTVDGSVFFGNVVAAGEICMFRATIGGMLSFIGAKLTNPGATVLSLDGLSVVSGVHCGGDFTADGGVRLGGARIGSWLHLNGGQLSNPHDDALTCSGATIGLLRLHTRQPVAGTVDLSHTRIEQIDDDLLSWPDRLRLDGLTYQTLTTPGNAEERLNWIRGDDSRSYLPQPYEQLAATYRRLGDDPAARQVLLAKHRRRRTTLPWHGKAWGHLQDLTVGYGYRPLRAATSVLALLATGTTAYLIHHPLPLDPGRHPGFNPLIYTLDLLLPIANFGQEQAFNPNGPWQWLAYALTASGWILTTAIAAGITRTITRP
jgi:hypothetical protein